jgi:hypothetical protein
MLERWHGAEGSPRVTTMSVGQCSNDGGIASLPSPAKMQRSRGRTRSHAARSPKGYCTAGRSVAELLSGSIGLIVVIVLWWLFLQARRRRRRAP